MKEMRVYILHVMLREFDKNATETAKKNFSIYGQGVITE